MVEKLKFPTKEHPHPCNLQFLNMDNEGVIKIKMAPLLLNEFNDGKVKFKQLWTFTRKGTIKDNTKLCLLRPVPKPSLENVGPNDVLGLLWTQQQKDSINDSYHKINDVFMKNEEEIFDSRTSLFQPGENDRE